jgi:hypothetical protein
MVLTVWGYQFFTYTIFFWRVKKELRKKYREENKSKNKNLKNKSKNKSKNKKLKNKSKNKKL